MRTLSHPLKWHGGKHYLAKEIVARMPSHLNYVEPYFGGGAVLFARDPADSWLWSGSHHGVSEVVNDLHGELTNFWRVLQDQRTFEQFRRIVQAVPFSECEFGDGQSLLDISPPDGDPAVDPVDRAVAFFVVNRQSLAGRMKGFTGITKTRTRAGMNNEVSAWISAVDGLPAVHARLRRVLILNRPALDVIDQFDRPETFFYLDPPYLHSTRATTEDYAHEMTEADHVALLDRIKRCEGRIMISGYPSNLYDSALHGWERHEIKIANHASGAKQKAAKSETLWMNYRG